MCDITTDRRAPCRKELQMERSEQALGDIDIDIERPSAARLLDYSLGGSLNFAADRELFEQLVATMPDVGQIAQAGLAFVRRAVRFCVDAGIVQFLDLGWSGIPARGRVHDIAPEARVMYVDTDPVAVAHGRAVLAGNERVGVVQEDLRRPERVFAHPDVRGLLDFDRPMAVLLGGALSLISDEDDPAGIVVRLRDAMAPGGYLVMSGLAFESRPEEMAKILHLMRLGGIVATPRTRAQVERLFAGFELVEPGLVWVPQWRPDSPDDVGDHPERSIILGGVGRKP
jgi:SAM-dependent methyltransferase